MLHLLFPCDVTGVVLAPGSDTVPQLAVHRFDQPAHQLQTAVEHDWSTDLYNFSNIPCTDRFILNDDGQIAILATVIHFLLQAPRFTGIAWTRRDWWRGQRFGGYL